MFRSVQREHFASFPLTLQKTIFEYAHNVAANNTAALAAAMQSDLKQFNAAKIADQFWNPFALHGELQRAAQSFLANTSKCDDTAAQLSEQVAVWLASSTEYTSVRNRFVGVCVAALLVVVGIVVMRCR